MGDGRGAARAQGEVRAPPPRARRRRTAPRSTFLSNFPTLVFGTSTMNVHRSGSCHLATCDARNSRRSDALALDVLAAHDARERTLVPPRVGDRDHRRLDDVGVRHQVALELDRRDPLAARLDDVLRAVGDLHVAVGRDAGDVAGAQPAVVELLGRGVAVVGAGDPRAPALDLAHRLAVPRQHGAVVVDDAQLHAGERPAGERPPVHLLRGAELDAARRQRHRRHRAGLGHAPGLQHADAEPLLERLHQRARHGRATAHDPLQRREVDLVVLGVAQEVGPDGGHRARGAWGARWR